MSIKALIPIADGSEDIESVTLIDVLRRAEVDVTVASVHDRKEVTAARRTRITADTLLLDCLEQDYDLIVLPGGKSGAENLRDCQPLIDRVRRQKEDGRWFAAICAAPGVALASQGLLDGFAATGHPGFRDTLPDKSRVEERVVVDRNCITSQGPGTAMEFALELVEQLCGRETRETVAGPMVLAGH